MRRPLILGALVAGFAALLLVIRGGRGPLDPPPGLPDPAEAQPAAEPAPSPPPPPDDRAAHNGIFAALGRFTYRNRRWLPIAGLALVIGLNVWAATAGGTLSQGGWQIEGSESEQAEALAADRFGEQATSMIVILTDPDGDAGSEEFQATVAEAVAPLEGEPVRQRDPHLRRRRRPVLREP